MRKFLIVIVSSLFLVGCDIVEKGFYMLWPAESVHVPIVLGSMDKYTANLSVRYINVPYRVYLTTKFLEHDNFANFELVNQLNYKYNFTIKGYIVNDNGGKELVINENFSDERLSFQIYGLKPEYAKCIFLMDLNPGNYVFEIQDNSIDMDIYNKISNTIDFEVDAVIN